MKDIFPNKSILKLHLWYFIKKQIFVLFFITALVLLISSCSTQRPYIAASGPALQEAEINGVHVTCLYLNLNDIEKRHGFRANPFFPPDLAVTPQHMIVFELTITNKDSAPIRLENRRVELFLGDRRYTPMSRGDMEAKIEEHSERRDRLTESRVAQQFMLSSITNIRGNGTATGYLVFMGPFRGRDIPTELVLPFSTPDGASAADITFSYTLTLHR